MAKRYFHLFTRVRHAETGAWCSWGHETAFDNRRDAMDEARDYREHYVRGKCQTIVRAAEFTSPAADLDWIKATCADLDAQA